VDEAAPALAFAVNTLTAASAFTATEKRRAQRDVDVSPSAGHRVRDKVTGDRFRD
jgi:hypothetical protein